MAIQVHEYTTPYLKLLWEAIKRARAEGKPGDVKWENEVEAEMKKRKLPL